MLDGTEPNSRLGVTLSFGNLTNDGNGNTFSYDPEGKLTSSVVGGVSSTYKNDPLGHRAESVTSAGTFDYVYDPSGRLITEADTTCNSGTPYYPCTDFVYIGASSIPFSQFSDWACCAAYATFNYYDFAGSLRETTSYAGLSTPYQNDPFGDSSSAQPGWFGFAQLLTMGSGLQLSSTRGYHQLEARWLTPDPSGMQAVNPQNPQSWNQYAYVLNNPVSATDALGLFCKWDDGTNDATDDPDTGTQGSCEGQGGTWVDDNGTFTEAFLGNPNPDTFTFQAQASAQADKGLFTCASEAASKVSIAGGLQSLGIGKSGAAGFVTNALGGNAFSGATDLIQSLGSGKGGGHSAFYNLAQGVAAGPTQGFRSAFGNGLQGTPWASGPADVATDAILNGAQRAVTGSGQTLQTLNGTAELGSVLGEAGEWASGFGEAKTIYDGLTYFGSMAGCALGLI